MEVCTAGSYAKSVTARQIGEALSRTCSSLKLAVGLTTRKLTSLLARTTSKLSCALSYVRRDLHGYTRLSKDGSSGQPDRQAMIELLKPYQKMFTPLLQTTGASSSGTKKLPNTESRFLLHASLFVMGARHERIHEWADTTVLPIKPGLHHHYTAGD